MAAGNNHGELKGSIAGQTFSITTKDIIPVLLILAGLVGGFLIWRAVDKRLEGLHMNHVRMFELLLNGQQTRQSEAQQILKWLQVHELNQGRPHEERFPLDFDPAKIPPKPNP